MTSACAPPTGSATSPTSGSTASGCGVSARFDPGLLVSGLLSFWKAGGLGGGQPSPLHRRSRSKFFGNRCAIPSMRRSTPVPHHSAQAFSASHARNHNTIRPHVGSASRRPAVAPGTSAWRGRRPRCESAPPARRADRIRSDAPVYTLSAQAGSSVAFDALAHCRGVVVCHVSRPGLRANGVAKPS